MNAYPCKRRNPVLPRQQRGVGLIEVLIAVLVLAIGLLGIAALQATALRNSQSSLERSQAVVNSYTIYDAMRANRAVALAGGYNTGLTCALPAAGSLAQSDIRRWFEFMRASFGGDPGEICGAIECDGDGKCKVTVQWNDSRAGGEDAEEFQIITKTQI